MEQIVLNTNLRFLLKTLSFEEKGRLLVALLEGSTEGVSDKVADMYFYIVALQEEMTKKKRKMKELSNLAVAAKKRLMPDLFNDNQPTVTDGAPSVLKRKEAKEKILNNKIKKISSVSSDLKTKEERGQTPDVPFVPPKVFEVRAFVQKYGLRVNPQEFVDFYTSHGWCVGKTSIKNWQATVRLWHQRSGFGAKRGDGENSLSATAGNMDKTSAIENEDKRRDCVDESMNLDEQKLSDPLNRFGYVYCGGKAELVDKGEKEPPPNQKTEFVREAGTPQEESPFVRFMQRIENNDISLEEK